MDDAVADGTSWTLSRLKTTIRRPNRSGASRRLKLSMTCLQGFPWAIAGSLLMGNAASGFYELRRELCDLCSEATQSLMCPGACRSYDRQALPHLVATREWISEQAVLARHFNAEVFIGKAGGDAAAGGTVEEADLNEEGFVHLFEGILLFG